MANTPIRRFAKIFLPALLGFVIGWLFFELIHKNASNNGIIYVNDMKIKIPNPCIIAYLNLEEPMFGRLFCERDEGIGLMNLSMDPRKLEGAKIKLRDKNFKSGYASATANKLFNVPDSMFSSCCFSFASLLKQ